jgi:hypothetical protein
LHVVIGSSAGDVRCVGPYGKEPGVTRYADRKAKIRAYMAAHPGMTYSQAAARHLGTGTQLALTLPPAEPTSPVATLAATLVGLGQNDLARTICAARARWDEQAEEARPLAQATQDAYDAMINAPARLSRAKMHALRLAFGTAQDAEDYLRRGDDPYEEVDLFLSTAYVLLTRAASIAAGGPALAQVAADVLDGQPLDFAADAIRTMRFRPTVPSPVDTPSARHAHAAAETLIAATATPSHSDEEWTACMNLIKKSAELAHASANASTGEAIVS